MTKWTSVRIFARTFILQVCACSVIVCTWNKNVLNAERNNKWKASSKNKEKKFDSFKASNTIWKFYAIHLRVPCEAHRISFIIFEMPSIFSIVARFFSTFLPVNVSLTLFNFIWVLSKSDLFGWSVFNYGLIEVNRKLHTHWGGRSKHMCHMRIFGAVCVCVLVRSYVSRRYSILSIPLSLPIWF